MHRLAILCLAILVLSACARVEGTGRRQLLLTSEGQEAQMGLEAYQEIKKTEPISTDPEVTAFVRRVGERIAAVAPQKGFQYEFTVIDSPTANAFCLPGGKVAVYTGILPYCQNEAGLATVIGHEIGHAIARHGGERVSQGMIAQGLQSGLGAVLEAKGVQPTTSNLTLAAVGGLAQVGVLLPYSRHQETEADTLGLDYMARAGYDPAESVQFWQRFAALGGGGPAFLSTHPASDQRAADLNAQMPKAQALYQAAPQRHGAGEPVPARYRTPPAKK